MFGRHNLEGTWEAIVGHADGSRVAKLANGERVPLINKGSLQPRKGEKWVVRIKQQQGRLVAFPVKDATPRPPAPPRDVPEPKPAPVRPASVPSSPLRPVLRGRVHPGTLIRPGERVALFVDNENFTSALHDLRHDADFAGIIDFCKGQGVLINASIHMVSSDPNEGPQRAFLDYLSHIGFTPHTKPPKLMRDNQSGEVRSKRSVDGELTVDILVTAPTWDVAWLLSGDSDYEAAVRHLRAQGKRVYILTTDAALSRELAHAANPPVFYVEDHEELRRSRAKAASAEA